MYGKSSHGLGERAPDVIKERKSFGFIQGRNGSQILQKVDRRLCGEERNNLRDMEALEASVREHLGNDKVQRNQVMAITSCIVQHLLRQRPQSPV